jgi:uncharacterized membrane protein
MQYCFFVAMGSLRVSIKDIRPGPYVSQADVPDVLSLSSNGVLQLAELGYFIPLSASKIDDKSKANVFQKALLLLQISWMVLQCLIRRMNKAPLALLEIHVIVHITCTIKLFVFWFKVCSKYRLVIFPVN